MIHDSRSALIFKYCNDHDNKVRILKPVQVSNHSQVTRKISNNYTHCSTHIRSTLIILSTYRLRKSESHQFLFPRKRSDSNLYYYQYAIFQAEVVEKISTYKKFMTKIIQTLDISHEDQCVMKYKIEKLNKTDHFFKISSIEKLTQEQVYISLQHNCRTKVSQIMVNLNFIGNA